MHSKISDTQIKRVHENEFVISIRDLKKSFGTREVLSGINLDLRKNENVVVLGKSGAGKSVLIKCIVGLIQSDSGSLNVFGQDLKATDSNKLNELRKKIGFLFQSAALYDSMTVKENLEFPLRRNKTGLTQKQVDLRITEILEKVGLEKALHMMPSELSGGMRKRIGLARTFIMKPEIMLYDEPTTGLDPVTSKEISSLIVNMQKQHGISSIIITHDLQCAKIAGDRIAVLSEGKIKKEGSYHELEKSDENFLKDFF